MNGLSLFSNVGIGETYLYKNNINIKVANELINERAMFYSYMHPKTNMIVGDITNEEVYNKIIKDSKKEKVEFLIATPPCQGMSSAGKRDEFDPRNTLIKKVVSAILDLNIKYALIENVPEMLRTNIYDNGKIISIVNYIKNNLEEFYNINYKVVNAEDYKTPQSRKRSIFLISRKDQKELKFPEKKYAKITLREAIGHLPSLESGEDSGVKYHKAKSHSENHILWMKNTPTGKTALDNEIYYPVKNGRKIKAFKTAYKRMNWDEPAKTITMNNGSISSQNNVHPGRLKDDGTYSDARVLTLKELMILTGLPDNWNPPDWASDTLIRKVIGESFPPMLSYYLTKI